MKIENIEAKALTFGLSIMVLLSIFTKFSHHLGIEIPHEWEIPLIFVSLLLISLMLTHMLSIESSVNELVSQSKAIPVKSFDNYKDFYDALSKSMFNSKSSIDVTHIRGKPPSDFRVGEGYFSLFENLVEKRPEVIFRRVTTESNEQMKSWVTQLKGQFEGFRNFKLRTVKWNHDFPMINMAIIDEEEVFLALSTIVEEKTAGLYIKDEHIVRHFTEYYDNLWEHAKDA